MKNALRAIVLAAVLIAGPLPVSAQNLPPGTVQGRLPPIAGPVEAIPFATLLSQLQLFGNVTTGPTSTTVGDFALWSSVNGQTLSDGGTPGTLAFVNGGTGVNVALAASLNATGGLVGFNGALGTPASGVGTNLTGTAAGFTAGHVTTNANLTGPVTSVGNATTIGANQVANTNLATAPAYTLKGNATGSTATPGDIDVTALTSKGSPVSADIVLIQDSAASNAMKKTTVGALASAGSVASINGQIGNLVSYYPPQGRLTLVTGTPVMTTSQAAKTSIFYTPYAGNMVPIYDGTNMVPTPFSELTNVTTDSTNNSSAVGPSDPYDLFVWNNAGTLHLYRGPGWSSGTVRGYSLTMVNGILLNGPSLTNGPAASRGTYVGTIASNGTSTIDYVFGAAASGGSAASFMVWNAYNRVSTPTNVTDNGTGYTYTSSTKRQARASAGNQISFISGAAEDGITASLTAQVATVAASNAFGTFCMGLDSTTTCLGAQGVIFTGSATVANLGSSTSYAIPSQLGLHVISSNEAGDGTNANTFNPGNANTLSATLRN